MQGYGGPAQPSPTIGQCLNGGYGWLEVECHRCKTPGEHPAGCHPATALYADLEAGSGAEMLVMQYGALHAARARLGHSEDEHQR
jgi:hypothetical protein